MAYARVAAMNIVPEKNTNAVCGVSMTIIQLAWVPVTRRIPTGDRWGVCDTNSLPVENNLWLNERDARGNQEKPSNNQQKIRLSKKPENGDLGLHCRRLEKPSTLLWCGVLVHSAGDDGSSQKKQAHHNRQTRNDQEEPELVTARELSDTIQRATKKKKKSEQNNDASKWDAVKFQGCKMVLASYTTPPKGGPT
jgi:hypothetical protein